MRGGDECLPRVEVHHGPHDLDVRVREGHALRRGVDGGLSGLLRDMTHLEGVGDAVRPPGVDCLPGGVERV